MSDEYLWDRTGAPDREVEQLEVLLRQYRYEPKRRWWPRRTVVILSAIAAMLAVVAGLSLTRHQALSEWVTAGKQLSVGETIKTRASGTILTSDSVGEIALDPNSQLEILKSTGNTNQLALRRGTLHATIWAPPSRFVVQTPSAAAIDLGCSYTLNVTEDNSSLLTVETGWVAFQKGSIESFIPAGASCLTRPKFGPGLPYWSGSAAPFRQAVSRFELSRGKDGLADVLRLSTQKDALTIWHLIRRTSGPDREKVIAQFKSFEPEANVAGLMAADSTALDGAWDLLGLGATGLFRTFQERWH